MLSKRNLFTLGGLAIVWFNTVVTMAVFSDVFGNGAIFANLLPIAAGIAATALVIGERFKLVPRDDEDERKVGDAHELEARIRWIVTQMQREERPPRRTGTTAAVPATEDEAASKRLADTPPETVEMPEKPKRGAN